MTRPRYAIYYAPPADSLLWRMASAWLGRDAYDGRVLPRPQLPSLDGLDLEALTADPRGYGFHATLKAPFELTADRAEVELLAFAEAFAGRQPAFEAAIAPAALGRFLAFRLATSTPRMDALAEACVKEFDAFRAPLSDHDLARRRRAGLTAEQDERLVRWGYPYVFDDFRFHMTLTGGIADEAVRSRVLAALQAHFAEIPRMHRFDGVAVFKQDDRDAPFSILERFAFRPAEAVSA
jgi:putative phosphonate metabolism protein